MTHRVALIRVYYEDTDAGGVVYYANYLKFAERARSEALRDGSIDQSRLWQEKGIGFVVRHCEAEFKRPARLDDLLNVETRIHELGRASMVLHQKILRDGELLIKLSVKIACIDKNFKPMRFPDDIRDILARVFSA